MTLLLEMCAAVRVPDRARTGELRDRCLTFLLDGLRAAGPLPGPPPQVLEPNRRWLST